MTTLIAFKGFNWLAKRGIVRAIPAIATSEKAISLATRAMVASTFVKTDIDLCLAASSMVCLYLPAESNVLIVPFSIACSSAMMYLLYIPAIIIWCLTCDRKQLRIVDL